MKNEDEFDALLRNKFSEACPAPFEEDKWARMEEMIIAAEKKKKRRGFFFIYFAGFITALLISIPIFWMFSNKARETKPCDNNEIAKISKNQKINRKQNNETLITENKSKVYLDTLAKISTGNAGDNLSQEVSSKKQTIIKSLNSRTEKNSMSTLTKTKSKKTNSKKRNENLENIATILKEENSMLTVENKDLRKDENPNEKVSENNQKIIEVEKTLAVVEKNDSIFQAKNDSISDLNNKQNSIASKDSILKKLQENDSKYGFFVVLGGHYNFGFAKNNGNSLSPYIGAMFQYKFSKTWAFSTGLGVYRVSNLNFSKQITERSYDFGYRDKVTTIQQEQIYYLNISLEINKIVNKHNFSLGINPAILFANKSSVSNFEKSSLSQSEETKTSSYKHGYGLNPMDVQMSVGYSISLGIKWELGANYNFGLVDVRKSSWTNNEILERNQFIRLNLKYRIK